MKKIGNKIKQNAKAIAAFLLGIALTGGTVYAATVLPSSQVGYDNSTSGLAATDVQGALDELYARSNITIALMQDFDKSSLPNTGDTAKVVDVRDGNVYTVKKLADGNVWMTENLRLANKTISSVDSNLPSGETYTIPASNLSSFTTEKDTNSVYIDSTYGGYYNWYTATAGWGTYNKYGPATSTKDICPKGWRLPIGGPSGDFDNLYNYYNSIELITGEPNFTFSGYAYDGSVKEQGSTGTYWSASIGTATKVAYALRINKNYPTPYIGRDREDGYAVRCVAQ